MGRPGPTPPTPLPASMRMSSSSRKDVVWQRAAIEPKQPRTRIMVMARLGEPARSGLNELHLGAGQLDHVAALEVDRIGRHRRAIDRRTGRAFGVGEGPVGVPAGAWAPRAVGNGVPGRMIMVFS